MKRLFTFLALVFMAVSLSAQSCEYTLNMADSYGDGWNGAAVTISLNGGVVGDATFDTGYNDVYTFTVNDGDELSMSFTSGSYDGEVSFELINPFGLSLGSWQGPQPFGGETYTTTLSCNPCPPSIDNSLTASLIQSFQVNLDWNTYPASLTELTSYALQYGTSGFTLGEGDEIETGLVDNYVLEGLTDGVTYDVYLGFVCDGTTVYSATPVTFTTLATIDVGVVEVLNPVSDCTLPDMDKIVVRIENFGGVPQTLIPFNFSINGVLGNVNQPIDGVYTGIVGVADSEIAEFDVTFDEQEADLYEIKVWTEMPGDQIINNDTVTVVISKGAIITNAGYLNDLEGAPNYSGPTFTLADSSLNASWERREPANVIIASAATDTTTWVTNATGEYSPSELSYIESSCMDLSNATEDPILSFSLFVSSEENYDGLWVETSLDGVEWTKLGSIEGGEGTNWYNGTTWGGEEMWFGENPEVSQWRTVSHPLTGFAGQSGVKIRFVFLSDGSVQREGVAFDDINITYCPSEFSFDEDITSPSTPTATDGAITLTQTMGVGALTYNWSTGGTTNSIDGLGVGEYSVTVTDEIGCTGSAIIAVNYVVSSEDMPEVVNTFEVFPNPTAGVVAVDLALERVENVQLEVHNLLGEVIYTKDMGANTTLNSTIDLTNQAAGVYFIKAYVGSEVVSKKLIKTN